MLSFSHIALLTSALAAFVSAAPVGNSPINGVNIEPIINAPITPVTSLFGDATGVSDSSVVGRALPDLSAITGLAPVAGVVSKVPVSGVLGAVPVGTVTGAVHNLPVVGGLGLKRDVAKSIPDILVAATAELGTVVLKLTQAISVQTAIDVDLVISLVTQIKVILLGVLSDIQAVVAAGITTVLLLEGEVITVLHLAQIIAALLILVFKALAAVLAAVAGVHAVVLALVLEIAGVLAQILTIVFGLVAGLLSALVPLLAEITEILISLQVVSLLKVLNISY